jgi:hypothetical protein
VSQKFLRCASSHTALSREIVCIGPTRRRCYLRNVFALRKLRHLLLSRARIRMAPTGTLFTSVPRLPQNLMSEVVDVMGKGTFLVQVLLPSRGARPCQSLTCRLLSANGHHPNDPRSCPQHDECGHSVDDMRAEKLGKRLCSDSHLGIVARMTTMAASG